jgi:hypothetical protein
MSDQLVENAIFHALGLGLSAGEFLFASRSAWLILRQNVAGRQHQDA